MYVVTLILRDLYNVERFVLSLYLSVSFIIAATVLGRHQRTNEFDKIGFAIKYIRSSDGRSYTYAACCTLTQMIGQETLSSLQEEAAMLSTREIITYVLLLRAHMITPDEFFNAIRYNEDEDVQAALELFAEMS